MIAALVIAVTMLATDVPESDTVLPLIIIVCPLVKVGLAVDPCIVGQLLTQSDEPTFTPRISGVLDFHKPIPQIWLSSLRKSQLVKSDSDHAIYHYRQFAKAFGVGLITYLHNGSPPPIYDRLPMILPLVGNLKEIVEQYWQCLQSEHLISLAGFQIDAGSLEQEMHIINRYEPKPY